MATFFINGKPAPGSQSYTVEASIHIAVHRAAMERLAHGAELLAEARMRDAMADPETWYALRRLYLSPIVIEGGGAMKT